MNLPSVPPPPAPADRMPGLDVLRVLAALAIICIHVPETPALQAWTPWCRFAVPAFTTMSVVLLVLGLRRRGDREAPRFLGRRFVRLYALFLFWNFVYLAARVIKKRFMAGDRLRLDPGTFLLSGFAEHLWYLAFIAWFSLLAGLCALVYLRLGQTAAFWWACLLAGVGLGIGFGVTGPRVDLDAWPSSYFLSLGLGTVPAGCAGLLLAWMWEHRRTARSQGGLCLACAVVAVVSLSVGVMQAAPSAWYNLAGIFFTAAALTLPMRSSPAYLGVAAALTLPVYCVHVMIIEGMQPVAHRMHFGKSIPLDATVFVVTVSGSVLFGLVLRGPLRKTWLAALHR